MVIRVFLQREMTLVAIPVDTRYCALPIGQLETDLPLPPACYGQCKSMHTESYKTSSILLLVDASITALYRRAYYVKSRISHQFSPLRVCLRVDVL